jgi:hypothetical protein
MASMAHAQHVVVLIASTLLAAPAFAQAPVEPPANEDLAAPLPEATEVGGESGAEVSETPPPPAEAPPPAAEVAGQEAPAEATETQEESEEEEEEAPPYTIGGWVEAYYAYNFNDPSNGITDLRGFDNRHNSFNLSNVALDGQWDWEGVNGRITLQWGSTPATYYLAETNGPNLGTGVGAQSLALWQFIQQAYVGYRIPVGNGLNVQAGLFLSPIGAEGMNVKDNWFYSRSNLFYGFPFYHTAIKVTYPVTDELTVDAMVMNGWNTVLDNNDGKTIHVHAGYTVPDLLSVNLQYLTGPERPRGAPEGQGFRHVFDLNGTITPTAWLGLQGQITGGFEPNDFGTHGYFAGALAARALVIEWLALAVRGDFFWEKVASNAMGSSSAIFWPVEWVSSVTGAIELIPHEHVSLRLEYRHDQAAGDAYFRGAVMGDGVTTPFVRNAQSQDTLTLGAVAWF